MWTRQTMQVTDPGDGTTVPEAQGYRLAELIRGGTLPVVLPPPVIAHDPSDPSTWTVPVRWT